jgi:hypothetical protein
MFNSQVLDVAIGLVFVYLTLSLICSAANEVIEMMLKQRAKHLEQGLLELLHDKDLVGKIYDHALVSGLFGGKYEAGSRKLPSYIPSKNFALALMDLVLPGQAGANGVSSGAADSTAPTATSAAPIVVVASGAETAAPAPPAKPENPLQPLRNALEKFAYDEVKKGLLPLVDAAGNDAAKARQNIEDWYNASMDRVSGWYKRRAQVFILIIGLFVTVFLNADSVSIVRALNTDKSLRELAVAEAQQTIKDPGSSASSQASSKEKLEANREELEKLGLPIGWNGQRPTLRVWSNDFAFSKWGTELKNHWLGWLLTAFALSLGAPFWFDLLNKFIVVRSTVKPKEKSPDEPSKD